LVVEFVEFEHVLFAALSRTVEAGHIEADMENA
jgi:hypothetical protein